MEPTVETVRNPIVIVPSRSSELRELPKQVFPNEDEEVLLRAALSDGSSATRAWQDWNRQIDLDAVDLRSFQLLPLVYKNLTLQGLASPILVRLKGVYRQAWYKSMLRMREMKEVVQILRSNGIGSMVFKDAGLASYYYEDSACCSMRTIDVAVHTNMAPQAMRLLNTIGWQSRLTQYAKLVSYRKWLSFTNPSGTILHLHWGLPCESTHSSETIEIIIPSTSADEVDIPIRVMKPTEQLFFTFIEGPKRRGDRGVRWVVDALTIIKKCSASIDWSRLVEMALAMEKVLPVKHCCWYLQKHFGLTIPDDEVTRLESAPTSKCQQIEWHVRTRAQTGVNSFLKKMANHVFQYLRAREHESIFGKIRHYPKYLQYQWELGTLALVPVHCLKRGLRVFIKQV